MAYKIICEQSTKTKIGPVYWEIRWNRKKYPRARSTKKGIETEISYGIFFTREANKSLEIETYRK
jgi:hypothetical protein